MPERESAAYKGVRERTTALVRGAAPDALEQIAPATPQWRVRDVLAHLVGVTADVAAGRLDGVATDPWTAAQVNARRDTPVADMLAEWDDTGAQFETTLLAMPAGVSGQAVFDAVTHEADIAHALGASAPRDVDAVAVAFDFCCYGRTSSEQPALRVITSEGEHVAGVGEPIASVSLSPFEFIRASSGRRSADEVAAYDWDRAVDPSVIIAAPIFTMRPSPLNE